MLESTFRIWSNEFDKAQDLKLTWHYHIADNYHKKQLLSSVFMSWTEYIDGRREKNARKKIAESFSNKNSANYAFSRWKGKWFKKRHSNIAELARRLFLQRKFFKIWSDSFHGLLAYRSKINLALSFDETRLKNNHFNTWIFSWQQACMDNEKLQIVQHRQRFRILSESFMKWREMYAIQIEIQRDTVAAEQYQKFLLRKRCFGEWRKFTDYCKLKRERLAFAKNWYEERTKMQFIRQLKAETIRSRNIESFVREKETDKNRKTLSAVFKVWRKDTLDFRTKKVRADFALINLNRNFISRCFTAWRLRTNVVSAKHGWQNHKIEQMSKLKRKSKIVGYFGT